MRSLHAPTNALCLLLFCTEKENRSSASLVAGSASAMRRTSSWSATSVPVRVHTHAEILPRPGRTVIAGIDRRREEKHRRARVVGVTGASAIDIDAAGEP